MVYRMQNCNQPVSRIHSMQQPHHSQSAGGNNAIRYIYFWPNSAKPGNILIASERWPLLVESFSLDGSKLSVSNAEMSSNVSIRVINCTATVLQVYQHAKHFFPLGFFEVIVH